jgi:Cu/Ag efflux protein CusF
MGKRLTMLLSLLIAVAVMVTPAFALSIPGMKHHETGNVTAVDPAGKTFTVTGDKDGKSYTFEVRDRAMLTAVKTGEHVKVAYKKQGARLVASSIVPRTEKKTAARR